MASAFVSYAHEDREFVLALIERLQAQGLEIRYDDVALQIGDSLIQVISNEITEGDFLIAVVSPASTNSEWCKKELAIAATEGINKRRVTVLPVRFQGAAMPPMLTDVVWADGDKDDPETLARRLAKAIQAHLEGRGGDAVRDAQEAEATGREPAHPERPNDVDVAAIDEVAPAVWDVLAVWAEIPRRNANVHDLDDRLRRLRWALDPVPDRIRVGLPLIEKFANADWEGFFGQLHKKRREIEGDIREELRSVRKQVAQGLPVTRRWMIAADLGEVSAGNRDAVSYLWEIRRGQDTRRIQVFISGSAMASDNAYLPGEVAEAKETNGRSVVTALLPFDDPPAQVMVTTAGVTLTLPD